MSLPSNPIDLRVVAEGLRFPEGPVAMDDGSVLVVEMRGQTLVRVSTGGDVELIAQLGGGPNGVAIGPDGAAYVCNNGGLNWVLGAEGRWVVDGSIPDGGSIQRVDLSSGLVETLYDTCEGLPLRGPNDLVFDAYGGFWFTGSGKLREENKQFGALYYGRADGSSVKVAYGPLLSPNGVGLSAAGDKLYVADTLTSRLFEFELEAPGLISMSAPPDRRTSLLTSPPFSQVFGPCPGYQMLDSLAMTASDKVCVGALLNGGITIFNPRDAGIEHLPLSDALITNLCFGGQDMCDVWISASGSGQLLKARWPEPGLALIHQRRP
jgi:gluconolactonase